jgi:hypothetical protein
MKSKLLLPLLGLYLSVVCVLGTTYTYNVNVAPGYTLFANQLTLSQSDLQNSALGQMLPGGAGPNRSQLFYFDSQIQAPFAVTKGLTGNWNVDLTINVGQGFYCYVPAAGGSISIPFTGTASSAPTPIPTFNPTFEYYLLGSQTYDTVNPAGPYNYYDITGYSTPVAGESLYRARNAVPGGSPNATNPFNYPLDWNEYAYYAGAWHPIEPKILLGEAVWIGPSTGSGGAAAAIEGTVKDGSNNPLPNWEIALSDGQYAFTDANGYYQFAVSLGDYTVTPLPPCGWVVNTGPQFATVSSLGQVVQVPFPGSPTSTTGPDLSVEVLYVANPGNPDFPCPNDTGSFYVYYYNKCGSTLVSGSTLTVTLSPWVAYGTYASVGTPAFTQIPPNGGGAASLTFNNTTSLGGGTLTWILGQLPVSAIGVIRIPVQVSGSVSPVFPFTILTTWAQIFVPSGYTDANPLDNTSSFSAKAKCSFDPNDKTVDPVGCGPTGLISGNQLLTYTVQFQNLGSAPAFDVVVTDPLDSGLDPSTLKILGASANYDFQLNGNQITMTFPNIYLPDAADDAPGSHGFFRYQVQPLPGLPDGTVITNQASVVFDKNPPILTAITTNTITSDTLPVASFTVIPRQGSAGHTNDFTYTGGTPGATFFWDFGPDAIPPTSTNMNPEGVAFPTDGLRNVDLEVFSGDCTASPGSYLLSVGQPSLNIASIAGNQVVLSWQGDGYSLQGANALNPPIPWQDISPSFTKVGITYFDTLAVTNTSMYYRLTDQP